MLLAMSVAFIKRPVVEIEAERASVARATRIVGSFLESAAGRLSADVTNEVERVCQVPSFVGGGTGDGSVF